MLNPTFENDLTKRMIQRMRQANVKSQILESIHGVYERVLVKEHIILSRPEQERLFRQSVIAILTDILVEFKSDQ